MSVSQPWQFVFVARAVWIVRTAPPSSATYRDACTKNREALFMLDDLQGCGHLSFPLMVFENGPVSRAFRREAQVAVVGVLVLERGLGASHGVSLGELGDVA